MFTDLKPYPDYAKSSVSWLGARPLHWRLAPGMAVLLPVKAKNSNLVESTVLSLSYGRIVVKPSDRMHGLVPASFDTYQVLDSGNIVVRPTDLQNDQTSIRVGIVRDHGIITSAYLGFNVIGDVAPDFAYTYLAALDALKVFYGMGSGLRQNLELADFKRLPFLLPPADEQAAIVKYLGHANARIDRAIAAKRKLIALLEEQKLAVINQAVTRGLEPEVPLKESGIPWLAKIPAHWEVRRAKEICERIIDCKNRTPAFVENGKYVVVRTTCIRRGIFTTEGSYTTDYDNFRVWTERGAPRAGDVFFTREAPTGEAAMVPNRNDLCMGQRMMYLRPNPELLDPVYLLHSIYGRVVRSYIDVSSNGSTVGHLRLGQVSCLPILWCPLEEQRAIVEYIGHSTEPMKIAMRRIAAEIELLREFRTRLTADVVTGQVDIRDAAARLPELDQSDLVSDVGTGEDELDADLAASLEEVDA